MPNLLWDALAGGARKDPEKIALTWDSGVQLSFGQLFAEAERAGASLAARGRRPGELVLLAFPHGSELVCAWLGCLRQGLVPAILPYLKPATDPAEYETMLKAMRTLAGGATVLRPGDVQSGPCQPVPPASREAHEDAYLQFSSGSTRFPRAARLSHRAVLSNVQEANRLLEFAASDVAVGWLPLFHDLGLVSQVLMPLVAGAHSVLIEPESWARRPGRLLEAIHRHRGTWSCMPNSGYSHCLKSRVDRAGLDLSCWRLAGCGAEPIQPEVLERFAGTYADCGFRRDSFVACYGMAENVAGISLKRGLAMGVNGMVNCGAPFPGTQVEVRAGGSIWIRGSSLFSGYVGEAEREDDWFCTGDSGEMTGGELFVLGRSGDMVICNGRNLAPELLEGVALEALGKLAGRAVAFGVDSPELGTQVPVLVCEVRGNPEDQAALAGRAEILRILEHRWQVVPADLRLVRRGWVEVTTSGKLARSRNRERYRAEFQPSPESGPIAQAWRKVLGHSNFTQHQTFAELGGTSLQAVALAAELEQLLGRKIRLSELNEAPTIAEQAARLQTYLVAHRGKGKRPPLIFLPGEDPGVVPDVAARLPADQPVYSFRCAPQLTSVAQAAEAYLRELKTLSPRLSLVGIDFGTVIAHELARQLQAAGRPVERLILVEGPVPRPQGSRRWWHKTEHARLREEAARYRPGPFSGSVVRLSHAELLETSQWL